MDNVSKEDIDYVVNASFTQPILYLKRAENADIINKIVAENDMLHTSPLVTSRYCNLGYYNDITDNKNSINKALEDYDVQFALDSNNDIIAVDQFYLYIVQKL